MKKILILALLCLVSCNNSSDDLIFGSSSFVVSDLVDTKIYKNISNSVDNINDDITYKTQEINGIYPNSNDNGYEPQDSASLEEEILVLSREKNILTRFLQDIERGRHTEASLATYTRVDIYQEYSCSRSDLRHLLVYVYNLNYSVLGSLGSFLSGETSKKLSYLDKIRDFMQDECN